MPRRTLAPPDELSRAAQTFIHTRNEESTALTAKNRARDLLKGWLTLKIQGKYVNGRADEMGHRHYDFDAPMAIGDATYTGIVAQRKTNASIDLDKAEVLAREKGIYGKIFKAVTTRQFDEAELYAANQRGVVSDKELEDLTVETESFALTAVKA